MTLPALQSVPALRAEALTEMTQRAIAQLLHEGASTNTEASYRSALRYWAAWFGLRYGYQLQLPVATPVTLQFIVDHALRTVDGVLVHDLPSAIDGRLVRCGFKGKPGPLALNTLMHRIAVLSKVHQDQGHANPCHDPQLRDLMAMTRRAYAKRHDLPRKKDALTLDPLQAVLATCDDSLRGKRDRALLLFAWGSGGRRRSEVVTAEMRALTELRSGEFSFNLAFSKNNQAGVDRPENYKPIVGEAADALRAWLRAAGITEGRIFRRVRRGGYVGDPLAPAAVRDIVQARCAQAGIAGAFSAHSLRSGFVTEASDHDVPLAETMALTGHRSIQSVVSYARAFKGRAVALRLLKSSQVQTVALSVPSRDGVSDAPPQG